MIDETERRRVTRGCLKFTRGTALAASIYEMRLLVQFIWGELTIEQVVGLADVQRAHVDRSGLSRKRTLVKLR